MLPSIGIKTIDMRRFDVVVAGEINPDLILSGEVQPAFGQVETLVDSAELVIGSSSVIFACGAARLGLKVAFTGLCGDDYFGHFMLAEMQKRQVDTGNVRVVPGGATGLSVILNRGADRAILTHMGLIPDLKAEDVSDELLRQARHLHVASYFLQRAIQPGLPDLFQRALRCGLSTSLDTNYDPSEQWLGFEALLPVTNVFLPNETEARSLARAATLEAAADKLAGMVATLAIKLGAAGALGVSDTRRVRLASLPVEVADTVGAGDSFDAGFIYGYLNGWAFENSMRLGVVCGALSTRKPGGTAAQATLEEAYRELS